MKNATILVLILSISIALGGAEIPRAGIPASGRVLVVDEENIPVSGANVQVAFGLREKIVKGETDENGIFSFRENALVDAVIQVSKNGYYRSSLRHFFMTEDRKGTEESIAAGKWLPWNPTIKIQIVERKEGLSCAMHIRESILFPKENQRYGFDVEKGAIFDLSAFPENELHADFTAFLSDVVVPVPGADGEQLSSFAITLETAKAGNGVARLRRHPTSEYPFLTTAPANGFEKSIRLAKKTSGRTIVEDTALDRGYRNSRLVQGCREYLLFRFERDGNLKYAVYPRFEFSFPNIILATWFVPNTTNDTIEISTRAIL